MFVQTSPYGDTLATFNNWSVAQKETFCIQDVGMLMSTPSLSSTKNTIKAKFFASVHTLFNDNTHYTDLFLSVYYPHKKFNSHDFPPILMYSVDDEVPIIAKIRYWELKENVLYFDFRSNVYDFIKKCSQGKKITFAILNYDISEQQPPIVETFSLEGFTKAHTYSINELKKINEKFLKQ